MFFCQLLLTLRFLGWIYRLPMGQFVCFLVILSQQRSRMWILFSLHLLDMSMRWFNHFKQKKYRESYNLHSWTSVRQERKRCPRLRFTFYFSGGLERLRGSVWGLYFCSSPHYPLHFSSNILSSKPSVVCPHCLSHTAWKHKPGWKVQQCRVEW